MTADTRNIEWGMWFGSFKTRAAARRYITMNFTGPKVSDRDSWAGSDVRQHSNGSWQVRIAQHILLPIEEFDI